MQYTAILLDDEELILLTLSTFLKNRGYLVQTFSSPIYCPVFLEQKCHCDSDIPCTEVLITDKNMPGMGGLDFVERQKKHGCKIRHIAVISGLWTPEEVERANELECKIFSKPFSLRELSEWLDEIESERDISSESA